MISSLVTILCPKRGPADLDVLVMQLRRLGLSGMVLHALVPRRCRLAALLQARAAIVSARRTAAMRSTEQLPRRCGVTLSGRPERSAAALKLRRRERLVEDRTIPNSAGMTSPGARQEPNGTLMRRAAAPRSCLMPEPQIQDGRVECWVSSALRASARCGRRRRCHADCTQDGLAVDGDQRLVLDEQYVHPGTHLWFPAARLPARAPSVCAGRDRQRHKFGCGSKMVHLLNVF